MPHALSGLAGLGAYTYLEFTATPKKIQEKSPLDPEKFIDFKLKRVEPYNHNTAKCVSIITPVIGTALISYP